MKSQGSSTYNQLVSAHDEKNSDVTGQALSPELHFHFDLEQ